MKTVTKNESNTVSKVGSFARRSYKIYQEHYRSRNLKPALTMEEFLENYSS